MAGPGSRGRRRGRPRAVGLQGRRPHLPARVPRLPLRRDGARCPRPLAALEAASGRRLLHPRAQLTFGDAAALGAIAAALAAAGAPAEWLSPADASARSPGIAARGPVLFEPASGVLTAHACLRVLCDTARLRALHRCRRAAADRGPGGAAVATADGRVHEADVVVDCAGPMDAGSPRGRRRRRAAGAGAVPPPGRLLPSRRPARHRRGRTPHLHRMGVRYGLRLPVPQGPEQAAPTRCRTTRRAPPLTRAASTPSIRRPRRRPGSARVPRPAPRAPLPGLAPRAGEDRALRLRQRRGRRLRPRPRGARGRRLRHERPRVQLVRCSASSWPTWPTARHPRPGTGASACDGRSRGAHAGQRSPAVPPAPRYVALLRSVNVAGHGRIAMQQLRVVLRGPGVRRGHHLHPDRERPVLRGLEEPGGCRVGRRGTTGRGLRRLSGGHRANRPRAAAHRHGLALRQGGRQPTRATT